MSDTSARVGLLIHHRGATVQDTEIDVVAEDVEYEFIINRNGDGFSVVSDGLARRGLPELYLISEGDLLDRLVDPDQGGHRAVLVARGLLALAQDVVREDGPEWVRPVRIVCGGRSATFELSEAHRPGSDFISLLVRDAPWACSVSVTDWFDG